MQRSSYHSTLQIAIQRSRLFETRFSRDCNERVERVALANSLQTQPRELLGGNPALANLIRRLAQRPVVRLHGWTQGGLCAELRRQQQPLTPGKNGSLRHQVIVPSLQRSARKTAAARSARK